MSSQMQRCMVVLLLLLLTTACAKLDRGPSPEGGALPTEVLRHADSVPGEWGHLIAVSSAGKYQDWVQLWFQDEENNIRMVGYSISENRFATKFRLIPRK